MGVGVVLAEPIRHRSWSTRWRLARRLCTTATSPREDFQTAPSSTSSRFAQGARPGDPLFPAPPPSPIGRHRLLRRRHRQTPTRSSSSLTERLNETPESEVYDDAVKFEIGGTTRTSRFRRSIDRWASKSSDSGRRGRRCGGCGTCFGKADERDAGASAGERGGAKGAGARVKTGLAAKRQTILFFIANAMSCLARCKVGSVDIFFSRSPAWSRAR